jgi:hypothetical protein
LKKAKAIKESQGNASAEDTRKEWTPIGSRKKLLLIAELVLVDAIFLKRKYTTETGTFTSHARERGKELRTVFFPSRGRFSHTCADRHCPYPGQRMKEKATSYMQTRIIFLQSICRG